MTALRPPGDEERIRLLYKVIAGVSAVTIAVVCLYALTTYLRFGSEAVGDVLVKFEFPPPDLFPLFYAKPVTWLSVSVVAFWFSLLQLLRPRAAKISPFRRTVLQFIAFLIVSVAIYEVLFNFSLWSALMTSNDLRGSLNPDVLINPYPNPEIPWNLVFATKIYTAALVMSLYFFYYLHRLQIDR